MSLLLILLTVAMLLLAGVAALMNRKYIVGTIGPHVGPCARLGAHPTEMTLCRSI